MNTDINTRPEIAGQERGNTVAKKAKIPITHTLTSGIGLGPIPWTRLIGTHAMVSAANRHDTVGADDGLSNDEAAVRDRSEKAAQRKLDSTVRGPIEKRIATVKGLFAEINQISGLLTVHTSRSLVGAYGEQLSTGEAQQAHNSGREQIAAESRDGSIEHQSKARRRWVEFAIVLLDLPVFLFAMFRLLNVKVRLLFIDQGATINGGVAFVFALLGTLLLAVVMRTMGRRHRTFKGASSAIEAPARAALTIKLELAALVLVVTATAAVMASRVIVEGITAQANPFLITALAAMFSALVAYACYVNYRAEYDNGSTQTDHVQHLSNQLRGHEHTEQGLQSAKDAKVEQAGVNIAKLHRQIGVARSTATSRVTNHNRDTAVRIARSYQPNRPNTDLPAPQIDFTGLDLAAQQAQELDTHHQQLLTNTATAIPVQRFSDEDLFTLLDETKDH